MTALNLRRNLSNFLHATATAVDRMEVPKLKGIKNTVDSARVAIAKAVVPNDKAFIIPKNN
jgi:hypothetical protein